MAASRSAAEAEASNPDADPALAAAGSRKRRGSSGPHTANSDSPAGIKPAKQAASGRPHAAAGQGASACGSGAHRRQSVEQATPSRAAAAAVGQDKRWTPGMYMDAEGVPRMDPHASEALRYGRWTDALATCPLAEVALAFPCACARACGVRRGG